MKQSFITAVQNEARPMGFIVRLEKQGVSI